MARKSVAAQVSQRMEHAARGVKPANKPALKSAALVFKKGIEGEFSRDGVRVGSEIDRKPWRGIQVRELDESRVQVKAAPGAHLVNNPTAPHFIIAAGVGGTRASRAARLGGSASRTLRGMDITTDAGDVLSFTSGEIARRMGSSRRRNTSGRLADELGVNIVGFRRTRITEQSQILTGPVSATGRFRTLAQTKTSARGKKALTIGAGGNLRLYARHPGTKGRGSFGRGRDRARDAAAREYLAEQRRALNWGTTR
jgi:hypothetical protein